ncbi:MAG: YeiH family putative sulfate export transporter [Eubacterium sp.]|nr:YeiH family putative sulfate export transporter [Candidatus Colimonas fimequi]
MLIGIGTCFLLAIPAFLLGKAFPIIGGPVFGILLGMILAFVKRPPILERGIKFTSKYILQYSIVLLGFEMNLFNVLKVGGQSLAVMVFTLSASFVTAYFAGKALKVDGNSSVLIGVGTSICGGSAIAATAPVIRAKDEEVAQAISTIFLFNIIAVFIFPALGRLMGMTDVGFGMWAGTAINDTSSVVAAGASWSAVAGNNTALAFATIVKLTRTLMIVPITLVLAFYTTRKAKREAAESGDSNYSIAKIFPYFVLGFVATAILNTVLPIPEAVSAGLVQVGKFMIIMAMTAIGLNTNLKKLLTNGLRPIGLGLCCWFAVAVVSLVVQHVIGFI